MKPIDESKFAEMWNSGALCREIAETMGICDQAVTRIRRRLNLKPRTHGGERTSKPQPDPKPERPKEAPKMPEHPYWTAKRDAAIWSTAGRYTDLCTLAAKWRKPTQFVVGRWHRLRAA